MLAINKAIIIIATLDIVGQSLEILFIMLVINKAIVIASYFIASRWTSLEDI